MTSGDQPGALPTELCSRDNPFPEKAGEVVNPWSKLSKTSNGEGELERVMGIEPTQPAWKAGILPLNYTRVNGGPSRS